MIYYLKTANREELYAALVSAGAAREIENENGEKVYAFIEGAEFDEIGAIVAPLKKFVRDESGEIVFKTRQELVAEATQEVLWTESDGLPEGVSIGDIKVAYEPAKYETQEVEAEIAEELWTEEDELPEGVNVGDVKVEGKPAVTEEVLISEEVAEVLWTSDDVQLPEGAELGAVKEAAKPAQYKTVTTDKPKIEVVHKEIDGENVAVAEPIKMLSLGDIKTPKKEQVLEQILIQEAVEEVLWAEDETLPEGTEVGDVKIVGQEAVYETKVVEAAQPAVFYTEEEIAESGDAYHANIRGIAGEIGKRLPAITAPARPARVWWS
jgi:hypothetical protein